MKKRALWAIPILCVLLAWAGQSAPVVARASAGAEAEAVAAGIIAWKKGDVGAAPDGFLLNGEFLQLAGSTPGDWYPIGLGRLGVADDQAGYLAVLNDNVTARYQRPEKLDKAKATEWHRIALAILASGGDPRRAGNAGDIDLIADGTYDRVDENGVGILGKQGINGFLWGLIALDSLGYEVPRDAYYTRDDLIGNILSRQLPDGGWALAGEGSDPDVTAMALQALAPYRNSEKEYGAGGKKVRVAVNEALAWLSKVQLPDGDFRSWGTENCESGAQVIVALCALGVDPFSDPRFITEEGKTVYDGVLKYRNADGGFVHAFSYDAANPSADPQKSNTMAGEQVLLSLAALLRAQKGQRRLYDFRPEQSASLKAQIARVEDAIEGLGPVSSSAEIQSVYAGYLAIDGAERSYVKNYAKLSERMAVAGVPYADEEVETKSGDAGPLTPIEEFTAADRAAVDALPQPLTTANRAEVLRLWRKIQNSFDFEGKQAYWIRLEKAKNEIDAIRREIEDIKAEIREKLYPFDAIGLADRGTVYALYARVLALSEQDRAQLDEADREGLLRSKTQVDNLWRALWISLGCGAAAVAVGGIAVWHVRKRKQRKKGAQMQESDE